MKAFYLLIAILFLSGISIFAQKGENFVDGELLVKFKNGTASFAASDLHRQSGAKVLEEFPDLKWQRIKLPKEMSLAEGENFYKEQPEIEAAQPNFYYHLLLTPNDTQFASMYGLTKISASQAWDLNTGSTNVVVANIDTGIKYTHEDLAANMWTNPGETQGNGIDDDGNGFIDDFYGYDFYSNDSDPLDEHGHGTHTAGTIGAKGNNGLGITGVNWNVKLMTIKIYSPTGTDTTSAMLINAYNYIRMMKNRGVNIRVTNNSYGGCNEACGYDQATKDAIDALGNANIIQAFAAGNSAANNDVTPFYPASYTSPSIISVASSDSNDARSGFSCFGANSVDLAAPGTSILSTIRLAANYGTLSGTSMATPHVAGAAALLSSHNPSLSAASIKATLMNTVDTLPAWNGLVKTGGRLNVARALQNQTVCTYTLSPASQGVTVPGGTYTFNVTAPPNCDFNATTTANWINITNGALGSGNGTITYTVPQNSSLVRGGTIRIGDQNFQVTQAGNEFQTPNKTPLDFDRDFKSDYVVTQNQGGSKIWHVWQSQSGYRTISFGLASDVPVPADYDGDGATDFAVFRANSDPSQPDFYVLRSLDGNVQGVSWGNPLDMPFVNDFDGDNKADFAVIRKENGKLIWYILQSNLGFRQFQFGNDSDLPIRGDFDGDGKTDLNVYRPANNAFYTLRSSNSVFTGVNFGNSAIDKVITGDFDGDGKSDVAVWRSSDGNWYWLSSLDGSFRAFQFGAAADLPTPGDYDGDGRSDFSIWRSDAASSVFYSQRSTSGFTAFNWGNSSMNPTMNSLFTAN